MPVHDWQCPQCGKLCLDVYQPRLVMDVTACPTCGCDMERLWTLSSGGRVKFSDFDLEIPGTGRSERVTSLEQVRRLEREGEARGRPFAVHQYSIDKGQGPERNAFGPPPDQSIPKRRGRGSVTIGRGDPR